MYQIVNTDEDPTSLCGAMDADNHFKTAVDTRNHFKNGARPKSLMSRGNFLRKASVFLLVAVLTVSTAMTQQRFVQAGLNLSNFWGDAVLDSKMKPGILLGIMWEDYLLKSEKFSFQGGLLFVQQGYKASNDAKMNLNYLQMPYNLRYNLDMNNDTKLFFQAGFYYGIALSAKTKTKIDGKWESEKVKLKFFEDGWQRVDAGLGFGAGLKIMDKFQIGLSYNFGLLPLISPSPKYFSILNSNLAFTAAYYLY